MSIGCVSECIDGQFDCGDGRCIIDSLECDGLVSCANGQDETNCSHIR